MTIARSTFGLLAIAVLGAIAALALSQRPREVAPETLLNVEEADIDAVTILKEGQTLAFERQGNGWQMRQPEVAPAETGTVVFLLNLLATAQRGKPLTITPGEMAEFGFDTPLAEIDVMANGDRYNLVLGDYDFSNQFIYALVDSGLGSSGLGSSDTAAPNVPVEDAPAENELPVYLVSPNFEAAISQPVEAWKAGEAAPAEAP